MSGPPLRVTYESAADGWRETTNGRELSLGGVFIVTPTMVPVGALVSLEIEWGTQKAALDGRVLSCREKAAGPDQPAGFAVRFIDLPNDIASTLHFMISTRAPRKGTSLGLGEPEEGVEQYQSERSLPAAAGAPIKPVLESVKIPIDEGKMESAPPPPVAAAPAPAPAPRAAAPLVPPAVPAAPASVSVPPRALTVSDPPPFRKSRAPLVVVAIAVLIVIACVVTLSMTK